MAESIALERLSWYLDRMRDGCAGVTDQDVAAAWVCDPPFAPAPIRRGLVRHFATALRQFSVRDMRARSSGVPRS